MKCYAIVVLVAVVAAVIADDFYSGKWNSIDAHQIIDNSRLMEKYEPCILNQTTTGCTPDAKDLARVLPEALETVCAKCSPEQTEKLRDILEYLCEKRPEVFARILAKIDPKGEYRPRFEAKFGPIKGSC